MTDKFKIALLVFLQMAALFLMIGMKQWTLNTGLPVVLETKPVDPRSLFSGDYIRLNYSISTIAGSIGGDHGFQVHDPVYVLLKEGDPYWIPVSIHRHPPEAPDGYVFIKGEVKWTNVNRWNAEIKRNETLPESDLNIQYGIENYYIPEGEGSKLERPGPNAKLSIRLAVDRFGHAGIKAVLIDGKERYVESLW
jgi:uncharacterized membrane-anchored protein